MAKQQPVLESMLKNHACEALPLSCIISDTFLPWTQDLADKLGIPRVLFSSTGATFFRVGYLLSTGKLKSAGPTWSTFEPDLGIDLTSTFPPYPERIRMVMTLSERIPDAACILINTFEEIERSALNALASNMPVRCVGPCLPASLLSENLLSIEAKTFAGSLVKEDRSCLQWLEKQSESSVLYISLGSVATISPAQLHHLALGIEASGQQFLWVIRLDTQPQLPEGFVDRT
eukprot:c35153_g1_i1 orf=2-697(+)